LEQVLDLFLAQVGGRPAVEPWQIQQVPGEVRIHPNDWGKWIPE
jgi:hypothetical protein